jgi:hypothetical protein
MIVTGVSRAGEIAPTSAATSCSLISSITEFEKFHSSAIARRNPNKKGRAK